MIVTIGGRTFDPETPDAEGDVFNCTDLKGLLELTLEISAYARTDARDQISYARTGGRALTMVGYAYTPIRGLNKSRLRRKLELCTLAVFADATMTVEQARYNEVGVTPGVDLDISLQVRRSGTINSTPVVGGHVLEFEVPFLAQDPTITGTGL